MKPGAVTVPIAMRDLNNSPIEGATLTCTVSIDGAAFVPSTNTATEVGGGDYALALTAAERGTHYTRVKATNGTYTTLVTVTTDEAMRGTDGALLAEDYIAPPTDYAKPADVQVTVNPTLTPEESAKLLGAAQEATAQAIADAVAALPTAADNADAVWDEVVSGHATDGTTGRFLQRLYRYFFNKTLHTNTSMVVYADDGTTSDAVMAVSGDTSSVTKGAAS